MKLKFSITCSDPSVIHNFQIITGFELLKKSTILNYNLIFDYNYIVAKYLHSAVVEVVIDGLIICYDTSDGYQSYLKISALDDILNKVNYYFKRSFNESFHAGFKNKNKIYPLGLNYFVNCPNNPLNQFFPKEKGLKRITEYLFHLKIKNSYNKKYYVEKFENLPSTSDGNYNIVNFARLWDSNLVSYEALQYQFKDFDEHEIKIRYQKMVDDFETISNERISHIRALKENFGNQFIGGLRRDDYSLKVAPDLVVDDVFSSKDYFMKLIKGNIIGVVNKGLHNSIGWKFAEFVVASKCILTDSLNYQLPGSFEENKNYLVYDSTDRMIENVNYLLNNKALIKSIEQNNHSYYNEYVRPDRMILNSLKVSKVI